MPAAREHPPGDDTFQFGMHFSRFGERFLGGTGIGALMRDLAPSPNAPAPVARLGGGNPAHIPAINAKFRECMQLLAADESRFSNACERYSSPQGYPEFIDALVDGLNAQYQWSLSARNVVLTNGSQNAFFMLFNLLGGRQTTSDQDRHILLPMAPEYIGYADVGIEPGLFRSQRPHIEHLSERLFKYRLDATKLTVDERTAALCVSRPTNPTGNVLRDDELDVLEACARSHDIPLIIDNAYGAPFPNIIHVPATLRWNDQIVLTMSLSKLGLPSVRTGIVIANEAIVDALTQMNAVMNLAPTGLAASLLTPLFASGELLDLCEKEIRPFYATRMQRALELVEQEFDDMAVKVHSPEGAIFLWLWFVDLPISSEALYQRLKERGVIVVSGHHFFPGLPDLPDDPWAHRHQCVRVNVAGDPDQLRIGLKLIADEVRRLMTHQPHGTHLPV